MAKKSNPTKIDMDVAKELEAALDLDLTGGDDGGLDMTASIDDFEAQISQAAAELAHESNKQKPVAAAAPKPVPVKQAPVKQAIAEPPTSLRPIDPPRPLQPEGLKPANDERQKDYKSLLHSLNRRASALA